MFVPYAELHAHSAFSFLDGASLPSELVEAAIELGYGALALTDHNSVSGSMELVEAAKNTPLKIIHGAEIDLDDDRHLMLLVESQRGWGNLCRIITEAHKHDRDPGEPPPAVPLEFVEEHAEGLVCLSGCAQRGVHDEPTLRRLLATFGRDGLRIELQRPFQRHDRALNRALSSLAARLGVPCVATGNVHAHARTRAPLQDAFAALRNHMTLDASEPLRRGNWSHVLASPEAMAARFGDYPEAVAETEALAERLDFDLKKDLGYRYPHAENLEAPRELRELCRSRFDERYPRGDRDRAEAERRLDDELEVIEKLHLSGFFLLHHEILELARKVAIEVRGPATVRQELPPGRGRGSSVSSLVCYLTGLSHVDPVKKDLALGRFLHAELETLPDIDLDFPRDVREKLIPAVHERYGKDRSALVAAFPTYKARGAIRELGKVLGLPAGEIERVARGAEPWVTGGVEKDIEVALGKRSGRWAWLARLCEEAYGLPRHLSQHSGGMIVSTTPLIDCCPVLPAAMEGRLLCQWDKDSCSDAGFLKIDLLGLGMLSAVERCVETIFQERGKVVDLSRIDFDDRATYDAVREADTMGVFQIESRAQMQSLRRTRPSSLEELTIQVAIVRPGPILGGAVNPYIERKQRQRDDPSYEVPYDHPSLQPVLKDTLGAVIFQDQVIDVAQAFAGFSIGEAEGLRRAMSRKRSAEAIEKHHARFVEGAQAKHGVDAELAERVWSMVEGFSGFGFPKAHGAAFGLLAYQSTYLRVHFGPEFLCALLNEQPMGFYPSDTLAHEAQRREIEVLPPDVNESTVECTVDAGGVRIGLGYVNGVRAHEVEALVAARNEEGPFRSIADLASRAGAGRPALEMLAWAGACDSLVAHSNGRARRAALWQLGIAAPGVGMDEGTQLSLPLEVPAAPPLRALGAWDAMVADYAATGLTLGPHPIALLRDRLPDDLATAQDIEELPHRHPVRVAGLVVARQRPGTANGVVFMLLEDEVGTINLILPPEVYERHRLIVRTEPLLLAEGRLEKLPAAGGAINVFVTGLRSIEVPDEEAAKVVPLAERRAPAPATEEDGASEAGLADLRGVVPAVQSFAAGRRR